jgi:hypothetical protein
MIRWLVGCWYWQMRRIDLLFLWPACREHAPNIDHARAAFAVHAFRDHAWLCLGAAEIARRIDRLE